MGSSYLTYQSHWQLFLQITVKIAQIPEMMMTKHSRNHAKWNVLLLIFSKELVKISSFLEGILFSGSQTLATTAAARAAAAAAAPESQRMPWNPQ